MPNQKKPIDKTKTLRFAREKGDLKQFIAEHEQDAPGDLDKLDKAIRERSDQETASTTRGTSSPASSDD